MTIRAVWNQQTTDRNLGFAQQSSAQALAPLLKNPVTNGFILEKVSLVVGSNTIPHKLGRKLQGWVPVRIRAATGLSDNQDANPNPEISLILVSTAVAVVDIYVF